MKFLFIRLKNSASICMVSFYTYSAFFVELSTLQMVRIEQSY